MTAERERRLRALGWDGRWNAARLAAYASQGDEAGAERCRPARIVRVDRGRCLADDGSELIELSASGFHVGDWALLADDAVTRLEERTSLARGGRRGAGAERVLAANVDMLLAAEPVHPAPNVKRLERMTVLAAAAGVRPVIVITKADLLDGGAAAARLRASLADFDRRGLDVIETSARDGTGLDELRALIGASGTAVVLGPSGAGKSSLVNRLCGEEVLEVGPVRGDGRGRHTTTSRQLWTLEGGGAIIDTPGLRAVGITADREAVDTAFDDLAELALGCRFADCAHGTEPGCAVRAAVEAGEISQARVDHYLRLRREADRQEQRGAGDRDRRGQRNASAGRDRAMRTIMRAKGRDGR